MVDYKSSLFLLAVNFESSLAFQDYIYPSLLLSLNEPKRRHARCLVNIPRNLNQFCSYLTDC